MNTSLPTFLDALHAALDARPGLAGVNIFTCPVAPEDLGKEALELANDVPVEEPRAERSMGSTGLEEEYQVPGNAICFKTAKQGAPAINDAAKKARDRAYAILEEIVDEVAANDTMSGTVRDVTITAQRWTQGMAPENRLGRFCRVEFTLTVTAGVTP